MCDFSNTLATRDLTHKIHCMGLFVSCSYDNRGKTAIDLLFSTQ